MNLFKRILCGLRFVLDRKILQEKPFTYRNIPSLSIKAMAAMVLLPCIIEPALAGPAKEPFEISGGLAMTAESTNKNIADIGSTSGAFKGRDFRREGRSESSSGVSFTNLEVVTPANVANKTGKRNSSSDRVEISDDKFNHWWLVYTVIALWPLFFSNYSAAKRPIPNALLTGPTEHSKLVVKFAQQTTRLRRVVGSEYSKLL
jgi:hypothetical protein